MSNARRSNTYRCAGGLTAAGPGRHVLSDTAIEGRGIRVGGRASKSIGADVPGKERPLAGATPERQTHNMERSDPRGRGALPASKDRGNAPP